MKKIIVMVAAFCLTLASYSEKAMAGPVPISQQESAQLSGLAGDGSLLALKAGGSFPNAPKALALSEESSLRYLEAKSSNLSSLKAGDGPGNVLLWVVVICVCVLLLRVVNII